MGSSRTCTATDFIKAASSTAHHFGFHSVKNLKNDTRIKNGERGENPKILATQRKLDALGGILTGGISTYFENNFQGTKEPVLFYTIEETPRQGDVALSLQIIGIEKSIAEALLIHTIRSLYQEIGVQEHVVRINSLGDRESLGRYSRELGNYLRKRIDLMPGTARELMKEHVLTALAHLIERDHELGQKSPSSLEYLNETSRKHFRDIIEYLDFSETPYEIDTKLLGHHQCYSQTLFAIDAYEDLERTERAPLIARGGRYDEFVFQNTKKNIPAVGAVVTLSSQKIPARIPEHKAVLPMIYMVQLGFGPKLRSLMLLEEFKQAQLPVRQALASDSLSAQLENARVLNIPYTVILGQKEYVDNTAIVRDMRSSSQESVPLQHLVSHLKRATRV